ncbi:MAG: hypothetical protein IJE89_01465 [Bacilli bacterium]|nr:hypothetical protein [Bacilli bacterium]
MNVINTRESNDERRYTKIFYFDNTVQIDSLINFINQFESNGNKMLLCECRSYDSEEHRTYYRASSVEEIREIYDASENPYFEFSVDFVNQETLSYSFSLVTNINSKYLIYEVDKKKLNVSQDKNRTGIHR